MASDRVVINLEDRARQIAKETSPRGDAAPSEDAMALAFVQRYGAEYRYVAPWHRWIMWDGKRWVQDSTGSVIALIRKLVLEAMRPWNAKPPLWHAPPPMLLAPGWNQGVDLR
jgi:hypothetical protein